MDRDPERAPTIALTAATNSPALHISHYFIRLGRSRTNNRSHCIIHALEGAERKAGCYLDPGRIVALVATGRWGKSARRTTEAVDYVEEPLG